MCVYVCVRALVWTIECYNVRVVLSGPFIRVGVSDSRGIKRRGEEGGGRRGGGCFSPSKQLPLHQPAGPAKPSARRAKSPKAKGLLFGGSSDHKPFED